MRALRTRQIFDVPSTPSYGIGGSTTVAGWIRDAVAGTQSLDCLWIGDSNTGYNAFGWCDGWQHGLAQNGAPMYGTMFWNPWNNQSELGYRSKHFVGLASQTGTGVVSGIGGSSGASAALKATFGIGTGSLSVVGSNTVDFIDVPGARTGATYTEAQGQIYSRRVDDDSTDYIAVSHAEPCPIGFNEALTFRAMINLRSGGTAKFTSRWANTANGQLAINSTTTVSASGDAWDIYEHSVAAGSRFTVPGVAEELVRVAFDGSGAGGANAMIGPMSMGLYSVYRPVIGTSCSIMEFRGGATLTDCATDIAQAQNGFVKTLLQQTRLRQIAAGGAGRVLICIQGGVNTGDWAPSTPANAITAVENIKSSVRAAWSALGYPASDLLFLFMVSHPIDSGDASLTVLRTYAQNYYRQSSDTLFVNLNTIAPYTTILQNNWYDSLGNAHLEEVARGYEAISSRAVSNILRYA